MRRRPATVASCARLLASALAVSVWPFVFSTWLAAQPTPRVAVADFSGILSDGDAQLELGPTVTAMLITEFDRFDGIDVLERAELDTLLDEIDLQLSGRIDEATALRVGRLLGVQYFFFGQASSIGGVLRLDIRAVDVETSRTVASRSRTGAPTTALFSEIVSFASEFAIELDLAAASQRPEPTEIPVAAVIAYSRGLDHERRGQTEAAIEQYGAALERFPGYRAAQRALGRMRGSGGR